MIQKQIKFVDVTDGNFDEIERLASLQGSVQFGDDRFPAKAQHQNETSIYLAQIDTDRMEEWLTKFSSFKTRYFKSQSGEESAQWIFNQISSLAKNTVPGVKLSVEKFEHTWRQFSVIARLEPANPNPNAEIVVLSAHQDSVNQWNPWFGRSPGADDDGSG